MNALLATASTDTSLEQKIHLIKSFTHTLSEVQNAWMIFIILLFIFPPIPKTTKQILIRIALISIIGWFWANWFRMEIRYGWELTYYDLKASPDPSEHDGVGNNAVVLIFGWLPFMIGSTAILVLVTFLRKLCKKAAILIHKRARKEEELK